MNITPPSAADIMSARVVALRPETPIAAAATMLLQRGFSGAPVVGEDGELLGIFSEKDCMDVLGDAAWNDRAEGTVADRMTTDIVTLSPDEDLFSILARFRTSHVRRLPVVDGEKMIGLVARRDVLRALQQLAEQRSTASTQQHHYTLWEMPPAERRAAGAHVASGTLAAAPGGPMHVLMILLLASCTDDGTCEVLEEDDGRVVVGFWDNDSCSGEPVATNSFPIDQDAECYCWPGSSGENSADSFSCGDESFTYTQYNSLTCGADDDSPTVKTVYTARCEQDMPPTLYTMVIDHGACL